MSVISKNDATEDWQDAPAPSASDAALKSAHLLVEISPTAFAEPTEQAPGVVDRPVLDGHHQATIALNVSDVLDLGTEEIDGLNALVIEGQQGDSVHLANEPGYAWSRGDIAAPDGYQVFQANILGDHAAAMAGDHAQPVYVLVQHDLTVILPSS